MELLLETKRELEEAIYRHGGPRPGATREERVAHKRQKQREQAEQAKTRNQQVLQERAEKDTIFRLLEEVERSLGETPLVRDEGRWNWLCNSLAKLTTTQYFDPYPNWRARAWAASATMYGAIAVPADELACLKRALELNPHLPLKRRIKALDRQLLFQANTTNETTAEIKEQ